MSDCWHEIDPKLPNEVAAELFKEVSAIEQRQAYLLENYKRFAKLYGGYLPVALQSGSDSVALTRPLFEETKALIRTACDTATALIARSMPKATPLTEDGDFQLQKQAMDLDLFLVGAYTAGKVYEIYPSTFHASTVYGTGTHAYVPSGSGEKFRVTLERVFPGEVVVPEDQCESDPRTYVDRYRVMRWPKKKICKLYKDTIPDIDQRLGGDTLRHRGLAGDNRVWVIEAYHIDGEDRRRVLAVQGITLEDAPWPHSFFPYEDLYWQPPQSGFYGDGISYRQYARQERLDELHRWISKVQDLFAGPRVWAPINGPPQTTYNNDVGTIVHTRAKPEFQVQQAVGPEIYQWIETLYAGGLADEGISLASANNVLPQGLESAPAQREYSFKEGQRFAPVSQRYEHSCAVTTAEKLISFYAHAAKGGNAKMKAMGRGFLQVVDWPEVNLDEDTFHLRVSASSIETLTPAYRLQTALELANAGMADPAEARALLQHPDLERADRLDTAQLRYSEAVLAECMRGRVPALEQLADAVILRKTLTAGYLRVAACVLKKRDAEAEKALRCITEYLSGLDKKMKEAMAAQAMPLAGPEGALPAQVPLPGA